MFGTGTDRFLLKKTDSSIVLNLHVIIVTILIIIIDLILNILFLLLKFPVENDILFKLILVIFEQRMFNYA